MIGENKEGRETAINSSLKELTRSWIGDMGRLKQYSEALPASPKMDELIVEVYLGIAELAMDAVEYYLRPSYGRWTVHAVFRRRSFSLFQPVFGKQSGAQRNFT